MTFEGFYWDWKWWWGIGPSTTTRVFKLSPSPVNVYAFGALTASWVTNGQGLAYVGIAEEQKIDPNTGRPINQPTLITGAGVPVPSLVDKQVNVLTFAFGSKYEGQPASPINFANASMNILLWS